MHIHRQSLQCLRCEQRFSAETVHDAPAGLVIASWKALRCPKCYAGWRRLAILAQPEPAAPNA
jgi:hypothetical protein